jgi:hypothetical protein
MYATHQLRYERRGSRVHVTVQPFGTPGVWLCGSGSTDSWPYGDRDGEVVVNLGRIEECDHGGTRDQPAPWGRDA